LALTETQNDADRPGRIRRLAIKFLIRNVLLWAILVFGFALVPNFMHFFVLAMTTNPTLFDQADCYIFVFVVSGAAFGEAVLDHEGRGIMRYLLIAAGALIMIVSAFGYVGSTLPPKYSGGSLNEVLRTLLAPLAVVTVLAYAFYKIPVLKGEAETEALKQADR
jgi:hypothetical protein